MSHTTEHTPEVSSQSVDTYALESTPKKLQHDRHRPTNGHRGGLSKTTPLDVSMVAHPKSGLISNSILCQMPIPPWYIEVLAYWKYWYNRW